jgi:hypothetical protein
MMPSNGLIGLNSGGRGIHFGFGKKKRFGKHGATNGRIVEGCMGTFRICAILDRNSGRDVTPFASPKVSHAMLTGI